MCGSRGPTNELSHRALSLSLSLWLAFRTYVYVVHRVPTTMRQRQRPGTMLMLNSTDFDDFWPLHVHRALLDNDSRIRNHRYGQGRLVHSRGSGSHTRPLFPSLRFPTRVPFPAPSVRHAGGTHAFRSSPPTPR